MGALEGVAVLCVGVGFGLIAVRYGLIAGGLLMWINITIGGLRR